MRKESHGYYIWQHEQANIEPSLRVLTCLIVLTYQHRSESKSRMLSIKNKTARVKPSNTGGRISRGIRYLYYPNEIRAWKVSGNNSLYNLPPPARTYNLSGFRSQWAAMARL